MWKYTNYSDLISSYIEVTRLSYNSNPSGYADKWEWNPEAILVTGRDYLDPFMKHVKKEGVILVVGCGTGRDLKELGKMGYCYLGIDSSAGMINEAIEKRNVSGPVVVSDIESICLAPNSFDGVLIDSALEHIKKDNVPEVLEKVYSSLKEGGIALVRFRIGSGKVFLVKDMVGKRYFTSYTAKESDRLVVSPGFTVLDTYVTEHLENIRPGFNAYILRK